MSKQAELVEALRKVQRNACAYDMGTIEATCCDCKYGAQNIGTGREAGNGCPEMREVAQLLAVMTSVEFTRIQKRSQKARRTPR